MPTAGHANKKAFPQGFINFSLRPKFKYVIQNVIIKDRINDIITVNKILGFIFSAHVFHETKILDTIIKIQMAQWHC
jgi:hypothetical protein